MLPPIEHHFVIEPKVGVGPIHFGMHKEQVSRAFTYLYTSFFKTPECSVRSDYCEVVGLIIHYDDGARVQYIEVTPAKYAKVTLELFGVEITNWSFKKLVELLKTRSHRFAQDFYGYDFPALGINLYNDGFSDPSFSGEEPVDCIGVGPVP